jgi:hypothetical protein
MLMHFVSLNAENLIDVQVGDAKASTVTVHFSAF